MVKVVKKSYITLTPNLKVRDMDEAIQQQAIEKGLHPIVARVIAARPLPEGVLLDQVLAPKLKDLHQPFTLSDLNKAAVRIVNAIIDCEVIAIITDHDCDGQTAHAVLKSALIEYFNVPSRRILSFIGHRMEEGYGLSAKLVKRILDTPNRPTLVITADHGSADEPRISLLKQAGIDVIVTDHHQIPTSGTPNSAYACINPLRTDSQYKDNFIAGCMVAWLTMIAVRKELISRYPEIKINSLQELLDFVAVGTVADCVSMARSINNRIVVSYGLKLINAGSRPCWQALKDLCIGEITSTDLGFTIGPILNSDGRLRDALGSLDLLMAQDLPTARVIVKELQEQNQQRKDLQTQIIRAGIEISQSLLEKNRYSLVLNLANGHPGVHGIAASRLKDLYGRPTVFLAPKYGEQNCITGSIRGISNFNVSAALNYINQQDPNIMLAFGGHFGAGGVTLLATNFDKFSNLFERAAKQQLSLDDLGPELLHDGPIDLSLIDLSLIEEINKLEPFGREFEQPVFLVRAVLEEFRLIKSGTHAKICLRDGSYKVNGMWFNCKIDDTLSAFQSGQRVECAFAPYTNAYQGLKSAQLNVRWMKII